MFTVAQPLVPILIQIIPAHTLTCYTFKNPYSIILTSTPMSSKWPFPFILLGQNITRISHLSQECYMSPHLIFILSS
jgi:hypothetical protein